MSGSKHDHAVRYHIVDFCCVMRGYFLPLYLPYTCVEKQQLLRQVKNCKLSHILDFSLLKENSWLYDSSNVQHKR